MAGPVLPVLLGVAGGVPIVAQVNSATMAQLVGVQLSQAYVRNPPPGYPVPQTGGAVPELLAFPGTIPAGTTLTLFSDEAAALVAAGAASYA